MDLVAVAMTRLAWRDGPVEEWHSTGRISNSEMMRANAATTRVFRKMLNDGRSGVFWDDPGRAGDGNDWCGSGGVGRRRTSPARRADVDRVRTRCQAACRVPTVGTSLLHEVEPSRGQ